MPQNIVQKLLKKKNSNVNILRKSYNIDLRLASPIKRKQLSNFIPTFGYIIISNLNRNDWTRSKNYRAIIIIIPFIVDRFFADFSLLSLLSETSNDPLR